MRSSKSETQLNEIDKVGKMGRFIKLSRESNKLSQADLGEILNVDRRLISKWENGRSAPDIMLLTDICKALNISLSELLDGEKKPKGFEPKDTDEITIKGIKFYISKTQKKAFKIALTIIIGVVLFFATLLFIINTHRWNVYRFSSSNLDFELEGSVISNKNESIYIFKNIRYNSETVGTEQELQVIEAKVSLNVNGKDIYNYNIVNKQEIPLHELIEDVQIVFNTKEEIYNKQVPIIINISHTTASNDSGNLIIRVDEK